MGAMKNGVNVGERESAESAVTNGATCGQVRRVVKCPVVVGSLDAVTVSSGDVVPVVRYPAWSSVKRSKAARHSKGGTSQKGFNYAAL